MEFRATARSTIACGLGVLQYCIEKLGYSRKGKRVIRPHVDGAHGTLPCLRRYRFPSANFRPTAEYSKPRQRHTQEQIGIEGNRLLSKPQSIFIPFPLKSGEESGQHGSTSQKR